MKTLKYTLCAMLTLLAIGTYAQNNPPVANDDVDSTGSGNGGIIFVLNNDTDPDGNSLSVDTVLYNPDNGTAVVLGATVIDYTPNMDFYGSDTLYYVVSDDTIPSLSDTGMVIVEVTYVMFESYEHLDINMVKARFNANASDFWDHLAGEASYEVPIGSGKHTIFMASLWIAGMDDFDSLHQAATRYNSGGQDIYTGPIMDTSAYSFSQDSLWNRLWKVNRSEIDSHIANWQNTGYVVPEVILNWPAHGDVVLGQAAFLAPFYDRVGDQVYDPLDGDYPLIRGDQAIYFIRNDHHGPHAQSEGEMMEIEIHGMAYAYDSLQNPALSHTVFVNYKIVNRSVWNYSDTYMGINFDPDIGDYSDDYIQCDVKRGSVIGFNGPAIDGSGAPNHYGAYPPAQSVVYLRGPLMAADGVDNPKGSCNASVNGFGFGDSIIDNEALGMTHFTYYCNTGLGGCNGGVQGDPDVAEHYYNFLKSQWKDGTPVVYGGNGHAPNCTSCESSNFMFPDISDSCGWGTMGVPPGDTVPWNEVNAGNSANDRRGIGSTGPFTLLAGDTVEFDIAYVYARDTLNPDPYAGVTMLNETADSLISYFPKIQYSTYKDSSVSDIRSARRDDWGAVRIRPNPALNFFMIESDRIASPVKYTIHDIRGSLVQEGITGKEGRVEITDLPLGIFVITISSQNYSELAKFVKL